MVAGRIHTDDYYTPDNGQVYSVALLARMPLLRILFVSASERPRRLGTDVSGVLGRW